MVRKSQSCSLHRFRENRIFWNFGYFFSTRHNNNNKKQKFIYRWCSGMPKLYAQFLRNKMMSFLLYDFTAAIKFSFIFRNFGQMRTFCSRARIFSNFSSLFFCSSLNFIINLERLGVRPINYVQLIEIRCEIVTIIRKTHLVGALLSGALLSV